MKHRTAVAAALAAAALFATPALAAAEPPAAITVTGEGTVSVAPDQAQIDGGVISDAKTAHEATEANNAAMGKVLLALKSAGIEEKDYQTSRLSLQPQYAMNRPTPPVVIGYRAVNRVTIRILDIIKVASVIDALVSAGANDIGSINFIVSQSSKLLDEAREKAVADARRKAELYARAAGVTLGAPLSISEEGAPGPRPLRKMAAGMMTSNVVAQGEETLSVTVTVSWAIKAAQ